MSGKSVYDVLFVLREECDNYYGPEGLSEEVIPKARLRGAILKWSKEVDKIIVGDDGDIDGIADEWYLWFKDRVGKAGRLFKNNGWDADRYQRITVDDLRGEIEFMLDNHDEFRSNVESKLVVESEEEVEGEEETETEGEEDSGSGEGEKDYGGRFGEMRRIGFLQDDGSIGKNKIRGAMLKFAKDVDAIEVDSMKPGERGAREAFNLWMQDNFGNEWVLFITQYLDPGEFRAISEAMFERNEEYRKLVEDKWEYKPGNSKVDGEKGVKENQQEVTNDKPAGITDWGTASKQPGYSVEKFPDWIYNGDGDSFSGSAGSENVYSGREKGDNKTHQTKRYRLSKFGEIKADKDDMFDVEDITNTIIRENVWTAMDKIPSNSVDCVVTSPPYWALRDYDDGEFAPIGGDPDCDHRFNGGECYKCGAWRGQLGHEPDPEMFVDNIVAIFEKISRILKPTGSVFLNIGDTYAKDNMRGGVRVDRKSMIGIPYRIYLQMMEQGWVMRNPITWVKQILLNDDDVIGAANPTSVSDRINHTFEPMWWFVNSQDYYADIYSVRREHKTDVDEIQVDKSKFDSDEISEEDHSSITARAAREGYEPSLQHDEGANIPDAWRIPTGKAGDEHPAVFSPELVKRPIKMGCPKWVCDNCGKPYKRITEDGEHKKWKQTCSCSDGEPRKGIVFEPFCGRGTTPKVAQELDRDWITTEVSDKYADFAEDYIDGGKEKRLTEFV